MMKRTQRSSNPVHGSDQYTYQPKEKGGFEPVSKLTVFELHACRHHAEFLGHEPNHLLYMKNFGEMTVQGSF